MSNPAKLLAALAGTLALGLGTNLLADRVDLPDAAYRAISTRNPFQLVEPPIISAPVVPVRQPVLAKITVQGFTYTLGRWWVLCRIQLPPRPGEPPSPEIPSVMKQGERYGDVELVQINGSARTATFRNCGVEQSLTVQTDALKPAAGGMALAPAPNTGFPASSAIAAPTPTVSPVAIPGTPIAQFTRLPGTAVPDARFLPQPTSAQENSTPMVPSSNFAFPPGPTPFTPVNQPVAQPTMTPEQQVVLIELNRKLTENEVLRGELPPLPPTDLTPPGAPGMPTPQAPIAQ